VRFWAKNFVPIFVIRRNNNDQFSKLISNLTRFFVRKINLEKYHSYNTGGKFSSRNYSGCGSKNCGKGGVCGMFQNLHTLNFPSATQKQD
jgi:hypothetical protein